VISETAGNRTTGGGSVSQQSHMQIGSADRSGGPSRPQRGGIRGWNLAQFGGRKQAPKSILRPSRIGQSSQDLMANWQAQLDAVRTAEEDNVASGRSSNVQVGREMPCICTHGMRGYCSATIGSVGIPSIDNSPNKKNEETNKTNEVKIFNTDDEDDEYGYENKEEHPYEHKDLAEEPQAYPEEEDDICAGVRFHLTRLVGQGVSDEIDKSVDDESAPKEKAYCPAERNRTGHDKYRYKDDMNIEKRIYSIRSPRSIC
jgi:hypothetical protein